MRVFFFYPKIVDGVLITRLMGNRSSDLVLANEIASFSVEPHTGHANLCKQREMGRWRELEREIKREREEEERESKKWKTVKNDDNTAINSITKKTTLFKFCLTFACFRSKWWHNQRNFEWSVYFAITRTQTSVVSKRQPREWMMWKPNERDEKKTIIRVMENDESRANRGYCLNMPKLIKYTRDNDVCMYIEALTILFGKIEYEYQQRMYARLHTLKSFLLGYVCRYVGLYVLSVCVCVCAHAWYCYLHKQIYYLFSNLVCVYRTYVYIDSNSSS